jgi:hypothetical protein
MLVGVSTTVKAIGAVAVVVLPALAALFGARWGASFSHEKEHERWLRQQRLEAYALLMRGASELRTNLVARHEVVDAHKTAYFQTVDDSVEEARLLDQMNRGAVQLEELMHANFLSRREAVGRIKLLGPTQVRDAAEKVDLMADVLVDEMARETIHVDAVAQLLDRYVQWFADLAGPLIRDDGTEGPSEPTPLPGAADSIADNMTNNARSSSRSTPSAGTGDSSDVGVSDA